MLTEWLLVGFGLLLVLGNAIFVASEFALVTIDPATAKDELGDDRRAQSTRYALKHLSTELSSSQVGITLTTVLLGFSAQPALLTLISGWLGDGLLAQSAAVATAMVSSFIIVNLFSMLIGELVPKNFALAAPVPTARLVVPLQRIFTRLAGPVIRALNGSANRLLKRMGIEAREELSGARSAPELASLVRRSAEVGTLDDSTARLIANSIELEQLSAIDVMTDRTRMVSLARDNSASDIIRVARRSGHSRFPVVGESEDDILGLVHIRRAVSVPFDRRGDVPAAALMDDAPQVPETLRLGPLLVQLRDLGMQMAVVVDEYGGTSGVVTLEDVVEELVGDVADEHDERRGGVSSTADGGWVVPGQLRPDELRQLTGVVVPELGGYETLAGLVMSVLGRIPVAGDVAEVDGVQFEVAVMVGRRIERLRVNAVQTSGGEQ